MSIKENPMETLGRQIALMDEFMDLSEGLYDAIESWNKYSDKVLKEIKEMQLPLEFKDVFTVLLIDVDLLERFMKIGKMYKENREETKKIQKEQPPEFKEMQKKLEESFRELKKETRVID